MHEMASVCVKCGCPKGAGVNFCAVCGEVLQPGTYFCSRCGSPTVPPQPVKSAKSKLVAGLLAILIGTFGVHNFYLGFNGKAIAQLLITVLTCGLGAPISAIWSMIEGILILMGTNDTDADGNKLSD